MRTRPFEYYNMGDDMKRLREGSVDPYLSYNHVSESPLWDKHQEQEQEEEVVYKLQNMFVEKENRKLKIEIKKFKADNKRHITEKNQLGSKNHLLKTENAELRYRLSSYEEHTVIIKGKLLNAIKKKRKIINKIT